LRNTGNSRKNKERSDWLNEERRRLAAEAEKNRAKLSAAEE